MRKFVAWWKSRSTNEKLMYGLLLVLVIGICTRWQYVWNEIGDAFGSFFKTDAATEAIDAATEATGVDKQ